MDAVPLKILLVEDDADHAALIQDYLDVLYQYPSEWVWVDRLQEASERAAKEDFDVILLDLRLPESDYPETLTTMRAHAVGIPIVVLTALDDRELAMQAVREGAQDYLVKTELSSELLVRTIRYAVERARYRRHLEEMNAELEDKVAERTRDVERANELLAQRNQELSDFTYIASHDLQEPLRKVQAFSGLLAEDVGDRLGEDALMYIERVQSAAERMSKLISDLLAFSRIATRGGPFNRVALTSVVDQVSDSLSMLVRQESAQIEYGDLPTIEADRDQMYTLFLNLVVNAIKFRKDEEAPVVRISAQTVRKQTGDVVEIVIQDNGVGFDPGHTDRAFMPFERLHSSGRYRAGTGMGLAICKRIAERHSGTISASSEIGVGSRFVVVLPVEQSNDVVGSGRRESPTEASTPG